MIEKLSNQNRIIIATVLSFLFFATYDYFFIPNKEVVTEQQTKVEKTAAPLATSPAPTVSATSPTPEASKKAPVQTEQNSDDVIVTVSAQRYEIKIDSLGRISKFYLNEKKFLDEEGKRTQLIDQELGPFPLEIRFADEVLNTEAFKTPYIASVNTLRVGRKGARVTLTQSLSDLEVIKTLTFHPDGNYDVSIDLSQPREYFVTPGFRPNIIVDHFTFHGSLIKEADETLTTIDDGDATGQERFIDAKFASSSDRYYTTLFYDFENGLDVVVSPIHEDSPLLFIKGINDLKFSGYIGPKEHRVLSAIDEKLIYAIEYGMMTFMARPLFSLLQFLYSIVGNWGWAIVVLTILIRLVLFPLTYKGMVSMNKLKELAPKVKELQAKHKGDKQKLNTHMMELYKKHGANPMGGCLPILLQIPVFFAIYRVLLNAIELKAAPWILWVGDLSLKDPYFILPIAMGITMYIHQKITPTNFTDPMQEKIMKFLPLIFTFFFLTFPAGLTLYWFINNLFSIAQQHYVNSIFAKAKLVKEEAHIKKGKK